MSFYEQISKYYDCIFPVGEPQLKFIKDSAGMPPKRILDVACGSGGYSVALAKQGYNVTAVDLDEKMVEVAANKAVIEGVRIDVFRKDMKELDELQTMAQNQMSQQDLNFDCIYCIGNSLVHLGSLAEISDTLKQTYSLMGKSGVLILQIINYDRIINKGVNELPVIKNDEVGLKFVRKYEFDKNRGTVSFNTILEIHNKNGEERFENSIELLPVLCCDLSNVVKEAGFSDVELYGDFSGTSYDVNSYMLVIRAVKNS
ncbi:MAG: class I SAM-dependent methyltransferase [Clostridia bacterium]|nr:class I SAM-dependent methyltransferase [Clostridia bacterium]